MTDIYWVEAGDTNKQPTVQTTVPPLPSSTRKELSIPKFNSTNVEKCDINEQIRTWIQIQQNLIKSIITSYIYYLPISSI